VRRSARQRYADVVETAWTEYRQRVVPQIHTRLQQVHTQGQAWVRTWGDHAPPAEEGRVLGAQMTQELVEICAILAPTAYRLGRLTGQTDYFTMWQELWGDLVEEYTHVRPSALAPYMPPLYGNWHRDSILKRAFIQVSTGSQGNA
jgi:hypothetical protein